MMTRKDFQVIADVIASLPYDREGNYITGPREIAECFAIVLRRTNPNFDTIRFIEACTRKLDVTV